MATKKMPFKLFEKSGKDKEGLAKKTGREGSKKETAHDMRQMKHPKSGRGC